MPQDPTIAESAKQRSLRVPLDYLNRGDSLARVKWLVSLAIAGAAAAYVAWLMIDQRAGGHHASPGRLAGVHAAWNDDCRACHLDYRPLREGSVDLVSLVRSGPGGAAHRATLDQACIKCHDEPPHHASQKTDEVASCAACHREHGGASATIVRPADAQCTSCHADINLHRVGASSVMPQVVNVTGFGLSVHPKFGSLDDDPGNIKFNHWLHLQPGIAVADAKQKKRLADLDSNRQAQYAEYVAKDDLIRLDCSACHQPSAAGDTMQPIAYEQHCRACHPLSIGDQAEEPPTELPHGLSAARLSVVLDGLLLTKELGKITPPAATADETGDLPLIPGKTLGSNLAQKLGRDALQRRATAAAAAAAKCDQCHVRAPQAVAADRLFDVLPAQIPTPWFAHARFDHSSHRHVECRTCHAAAFAFEQRDKPQFVSLANQPPGYEEARDNGQVMIAGIESCVTCHAPRRGSSGGARHDCAECHAYHGRDRHQTSFPGSSLGTDYPEAPASSAVRIDLKTVSAAQRGRASGQLRPREDPRTQALNFVSHLSAMDAPAPRFLGAATCASAGCHGSAQRGEPAWQTAFTTWIDRDPHVQAYNVLWTFRGREVTRLLSPRPASGEQPQPLTDEQHGAALKQRCIACHATPSSRESPDAQRYVLGVQCESCHGPAENWLRSHSRAGFDRQTSAGFLDTKDLDARAAACMPCHVGPNDVAGDPQVVDHDLIAAGHPRLTFEFRSYFESLPAHWDRQQDERRHAPDFHYRTWIAGKSKQAERLPLLASGQNTGPSDFALLDCAACHHALGTGDWRQRTGFARLATAQRPMLSAPPANADAAARLAWTTALVAPATAGAAPVTPDEAIQTYLALRAVLADFAGASEPVANAQLSAATAALDDLGRYLAAECFGRSLTQGGWPTAYELPAAYDPQAYAERVQPVQAALKRLETSLATPIREP